MSLMGSAFLFVTSCAYQSYFIIIRSAARFCKVIGWLPGFVSSFMKRVLELWYTKTVVLHAHSVTLLITCCFYCPESMPVWHFFGNLLIVGSLLL
jgi:hypothetical protein